MQQISTCDDIGSIFNIQMVSIKCKEALFDQIIQFQSQIIWY